MIPGFPTMVECYGSILQCGSSTSRFYSGDIFICKVDRGSLEHFAKAMTVVIKDVVTPPSKETNPTSV